MLVRAKKVDTIYKRGVPHPLLEVKTLIYKTILALALLLVSATSESILYEKMVSPSFLSWLF